jgi:exopolyphosphatase/guanosine-5'-triphosphate,3'-diphosphate pyrophosphatase
MVAAIIDLGTNTFNLLIVDISENYKILINEKIAVKMGEGGIQFKMIAENAFIRGVNAIITFKEICDKHKANKVFAFGTSAIRNANNGHDFVNEIKSLTGIEINIIDGEREAELIYKGVKLGTKLNDSSSLIMDIGGGSTEFIIANRNEILWKQSFEIGASRLLETFKLSNPILEGEIDSVNSYLEAELQPLITAAVTYNFSELIGSSGSFDTLAEVIANKANRILDLKVTTDYTFNLKEYEEIYSFLIKSTYEQRLKTKGIIPIRAEMIVISTIMTNYIIDKFMINKMRLSTYSLKEGVLSELIYT